MLKEIEVQSSMLFGAPLLLHIQDAVKDKVQLHGVEGLGPVAATVNTSQNGNYDGEAYTGSTVGKRNIVLTAAPNPYAYSREESDWEHWDVAKLRQYMYQWFMPKAPVKLIFRSTDLEDVQIDGVVESCEPNIFTQEQEWSISIICPQPDFVAVESTVFTGVTTTVASESSDLNIDYAGTVETGFAFRIEGNAGNPNFNGPIRVRTITAQYGTRLCSWITTIAPGKYAEISTIRGNKYVKTFPYPGETGWTEASQLNSLVYDMWPVIAPKQTFFNAMVDSDPGMDWTLTYFARYGGL